MCPILVDFVSLISFWFNFLVEAKGNEQICLSGWLSSFTMGPSMHFDEYIYVIWIAWHNFARNIQ